MALFINQSGTFITVIYGITNNITGSTFLTFLFLFMIILLIALAFRLPAEASVIFTLPMMIILMAFYGEFMAVGGAFLLYLGFVMAKHIL
jgi:hypothetical protein